MKASLEGSLQDLSLVELLQLIAMGKKTGVLEISNDRIDNEAHLYFADGDLTHLNLKKNNEPLNRMLIKAGHISKEQSEKAHHFQQEKASDLRYGAVLLKLNLVSRHTLRTMIHQQMEEALYSMFEWEQGSFRFTDLDKPEPTDFPLGAKAESLILEGSRRMDEWTQIHQIIPSIDSIIRLKEKGGDESSFLDLQPEEWELIAIVDGVSSIKELAMSVGMGTFETCKVFLGLIQKGLIEVIHQPPIAEDARV